MFRHGLVICLYAMLVTGIEIKSRLVTTDQGPVRGYLDSEGIFIFYGIPYATTPRGLLKFRPPLDPPTWSEPLEAVEDNIMCPQNLSRRNYSKEFKIQEDCLVANVYVPDTSETNLPVVVYFHGGAFQFGYSSSQAPKHMVKSNKIVAVNFNYRVGAHGFLCLGTKDAPGNAGLKDQVALLRWVQRNIASFGGNPNDVTINGFSAGSASVDLLTVSDITKGLFHKAVIESGPNTASFSVQVDPVANAKMIAKELGFENIDDINALEEFYKTASFETLYSIDVSLQKDSSTVFAPCIEKNLGEELVLNDHPVNIIKSDNYHKLPMLYGISDKEGIYRTSSFELWKDQMNENFSDFLPEDLKFANEEEKREVAEVIKQFYFGSEPVCENNILSYVDYFTDAMFAYGTAKNVRLQLAAGNDQIYLYEYSYADESGAYIPYTEVRGAGHCAQSAAVMDLGDETTLSAEYKTIKKVMRDLWLNFITTGTPVPEGSPYPSWLPVETNQFAYMSLNTTLEMRNNFLGDRASFWDEIYRKYFRIPIPPETST